MLVIVWEYMVRRERVEEFESLYRPDGPWVELFRRSPGFVDTSLVRDVRNRNRYVISDRWTGEEAYEAFQREHAADYQALNARGERLHRAEHLIGKFETLD
jgi:heme-degrading monooxygenase HmoA